MKADITEIRKKYGKSVILDGVSFSLESGNIVGLLGANGSGKSTLLSILAGVCRFNGGDFTLDGESLFGNKSLHRRTVGYVPQGTPLIEELSVKDNLRLWYSKDDMERELECGVLSMLGVDGFINKTVSRISGGMKKRLSIGCAMATHPEIILLDEPTASLDLICKESIADYLLRFRNAGGMVIISTHDVREAELCDCLYVLKCGRLSSVAYDGNPGSLASEL